MSSDSSLERAIAGLGGQGFGRSNLGELASHLRTLASMFRRVPEGERRELIGRFHNAAGGLPYFQDNDIGALILEEAADVTPDPLLRNFLYTEAYYRAQWCAQAATSGGEGLARSRHMNELEAKMAHAA